MEKRRLKIVVIGAGMAGILAGIKLKERGIHDIVILEKADRVGGTWRENTYPGLTCDVPSHSYTYSFAPNPDWSHHMPPGPEIQGYFTEIANRYGLNALIRFNEEVASCIFRDGQWQLETKSGSRLTADVVIAATGVLHHPSTPSIEGLDTFQGASFHSARWDHDVPLAGQRIGIIGNGSTGVQIVSALAHVAGKLTHFQRTAQWIMPVENAPFTEEEKEAFRSNPELLKQMQNEPTYLAGVARFNEAIIHIDSPQMQEIERFVRHNLEDSVSDPVLREKLRPDYLVACKRLIYSPDYYRAIQHPNSELVTDKIVRVEPQGVRTEDGRLHELDLLVLATGFKADQFMRPMNIVGRGGVALNDVWAKRPTAYMAVSIPDFPNMFMLNGPTGPVGNFSLIEIAEAQWNYIEKFLDRLEQGEAAQISASHNALQDYEKARIAAAKTTVFGSGCKSWYLDAEGVPATWPWGRDRFFKEMKGPDFSKFELVS